MLNQDYKEILSTFSDHDVAFLLVGAYAMAVHGYPRATADIDIFVRADSENSQRVWDALCSFGAPMNQVSKKDFEHTGIVFQIGVEPRRIDIITGIDGVRFEDAYRDKFTVELDGMKIPVISRQHLIQNKQSTGREKDRLDVKKLKL